MSVSGSGGGSGISWSYQLDRVKIKHITMPSSRHSVFHRLDAVIDCQPVVSKACGAITEAHLI